MIGQLIFFRQVKPYTNKKTGRESNGGFEVIFQFEHVQTTEELGTPVEKFFINIDKLDTKTISEILANLPCTAEILIENKIFNGKIYPQIGGIKLVKK